MAVSTVQYFNNDKIPVKWEIVNTKIKVCAVG